MPKKNRLLRIFQFLRVKFLLSRVMCYGDVFCASFNGYDYSIPNAIKLQYFSQF